MVPRLGGLEGKDRQIYCGTGSRAIGGVNSSDAFLLARSFSRQGALGLRDTQSVFSFSVSLLSC